MTASEAKDRSKRDPDEICCSIEKINWCSQMALAEHFGHKMPATLEEILTALDYQASQL
jgi:hypothetical protein